MTTEMKATASSHSPSLDSAGDWNLFYFWLADHPYPLAGINHYRELNTGMAGGQVSDFQASN